MTDQQHKELIEYGAERDVDADTVMELIGSENFCQCESCRDDIKNMIDGVADARNRKKAA